MTFILTLYSHDGKIADRGYFDTKKDADRSGKYQLKAYPDKYKSYDVRE